jgi:hypothetical protein
MDVEGHELSILRGGEGTIGRCRPIMLIEMEDRHKPNSVRDVCKFLDELGYEGYFILDKELLSVSLFDKDRYQNSKNIGGWKSKWNRSGVYVNNFFFVPSEDRIRLENEVARAKDRLH